MTECKICNNSYDEKENTTCPFCEEEDSEKNEVMSAKGMQNKKTGNSLKYIPIVLIALLVISALVYFFALSNDNMAVVPDKYSTIQEAIDDAEDGAEILVREGVYRENIDFRGKSIILRSEDPDDQRVVERTIIDGSRGGTVVSFRSGESEDAVLSGFSIIRGGGILVSGGSSPLIKNNIIEDNTAEFGGGIAIFDSSPRIVNNTIVGNSGFLGGGIFIEESSPHIENNTIKRNRAEMGSGVVVISNSSPVILNNHISDNSAARLGGGIVVAAYSNPTIAGNMISGNLAERNGGGILIEESEPVIEKNTISNNSAANGGGIFIVNSLSEILRIADNTISDNYAFFSGGGIYMEGSSLKIEDNHFIQNVSEQNGGAMVLQNSSPYLSFNVFESNKAGAENGGGAIWVSDDSTLEFDDPDDNIYKDNQPDDVWYQ